MREKRFWPGYLIHFRSLLIDRIIIGY